MMSGRETTACSKPRIQKWNLSNIYLCSQIRLILKPGPEYILENISQPPIVLYEKNPFLILALKRTTTNKKPPPNKHSVQHNPLEMQ